MLGKFAEIGIPIIAFFGGIGVSIGAAKFQLTMLSKTVETNCSDIKEIKEKYNDKVLEISQQLARIEERLGIHA